jgi:hypothetical protein
MASATVPLYQSEITAAHIRGRMISCVHPSHYYSTPLNHYDSLQQWSITWGILLQYFVQFGCSYIESDASFRIPWGVQMIPAIILSVGMCTFPPCSSWPPDSNLRVPQCGSQNLPVGSSTMAGTLKHSRSLRMSMGKATPMTNLSSSR